MQRGKNVSLEARRLAYVLPKFGIVRERGIQLNSLRKTVRQICEIINNSVHCHFPDCTEIGWLEHYKSLSDLNRRLRDDRSQVAMQR